MAERLATAESINEAVALVHGVDAACGPASAYEAAGAIGGFSLSTEGLQALVARGVDTGHLTTGGQDVENVMWDLNQYGIGGNIWDAPDVSSLQSTLDYNLSQDKPTVMGLAEAHYLTDEPSNLHGHYVTVVGRNDDGSYLTADPNTIAASHGEFTSNTAEQFFQAQGLGNITPDKQSSGRMITAPNGTTELSDLTSGLSSPIPSHFTIGFDAAPFQNTIIRIGVGALGIIIIAISFNNLLGGLGLPDFQSALAKTAKTTESAIKIASL